MKTTEFKLKVIFVLGMLLFFFGANAQQTQDTDADPENEKDPNKQTEWMKTELSLTNEQVPKVDAINTNYGQKKKALREQMRQQMKSLEEEKRKELANVLTQEQLDKYDAKKKEMKANKKNGNGHGNGKPGGGNKKKY